MAFLAPSTGTHAPTLQPEQKKLRVLIHSLCKIDDGTLLAEIDLRKYAIESGQAVTNATLQELCSIHPKIFSLILSNCSQVSDVGLWALAKHCTVIEKLFLSKCSLISHVGLRALALKCVNIIELDLSYCHLIDDNTLTVVAGGAWKIQKLNLQYCVLITDTGVARIAQGMTSHLIYLNVNGCPNIGEFGDRALRELGANCHNLEELYMGETKRIEDPGCICISQGCNKLKQLYLSGCENISKKALKAFGSNLSLLHTLKIRWNRKLADGDYNVLHQSLLATCQSLTSIELSSFETLGDKGVASLCKAMGQSLQHICLRNCKQLTDYSSLCISHLCPKLRALDFSDCGHITDESVHHLAQRVSALTSLKLDGNTRISNKVCRHIYACILKIHLLS
ncbi:hypothetical protein EON65_46330 [archaeon]|nr:MAG: hypothetical protein EON65_46330 [archaeon]